MAGKPGEQMAKGAALEAVLRTRLAGLGCEF
jgi:hypothetical protein